MQPVGALRQQDIVVLNPQTGEVLGGGHKPVQPVHLASKGNMIHNSNEIAPGGQPVTNSDTFRAQPNTDTDMSGSSSDRGGGPAAAAAVRGSKDRSKGETITSGSLERVRQIYSMPECQMAQLTVFMDRALVCRRIRPRFNASEITEVLFERLSPAVDKDSVRVEIRGAATILDVTYNARQLSEEEDCWTQNINELGLELRQCHRRVESLTSRIARSGKQRMVLDAFADNLIQQDDETGSATNAGTLVAGGVQNHTAASGAAGTGPIGLPPAQNTEHKSTSEAINPYDPRNMDTLHRFLSIYEEQSERLDSSLMDAHEELVHIQNRIEEIEKELRTIELKKDEHLARELSVLVEPRETGQVEMLVSYVVGRCSWKPAYDIRIFNSDGTMKIVYYGMVQQATGEDWETRSMSLSSTMPGTGGTVPSLGLQRVCFKKDHSPANPHRGVMPAAPQAGHVTSSPPSCNIKMRSSSKLAGSRRSMRPTTTSFQDVDRILSDIERDTPTPASTLQRGSSLESPQFGPCRGSAAASRSQSRKTLGASFLFHPPSTPGTPQMNRTASAPQGTTTTTATPPSSVASVHLEVPRPPPIIRCDNEPVRVTVGLLDLQPTYEYLTAPKRSLHAFLKATAVNRSEFVILAGQTNIYADNTFIGKSEIPPVAQGEEFTCNLGAENGIKVVYRPLYKYKESANNKYATLTFKQLIEVRNTFDRPIRLTVMDQVPVSGEDKIKVNLLEPVIKHPERYDRSKPIRMNKSNNVEWALDLGPGEAKELTLKYSIEYPPTEDLDVSVAEA
ncbi:unnamed protein product [Calicophoron daubneyi]|uniref:Protein F37C4.5 n=1 Tax=Calicophoron daubneyi TaxID=300641 RepID=A0AAV2TEA6_CALDB